MRKVDPHILDSHNGPRQVTRNSRGSGNGTAPKPWYSLREGRPLTLMASMTGSYRSGKPGNRNTMQWTSSASCSRQLVPEFESSLTREATMGGM